MTIVHSYVRYSTPDQAAGESERRQLERAEEFCHKHNFTLSELRFEDLGVSGFRKKNLKDSALASFMLAIKKKRVGAGDILLVEAIDRLSRSGVKETQKIINEIHDAKVNIAIIFPMERIFEHDTKDAFTDTLLLAAYADLAHKYSLRLSDFGKDWWRKRRKDAAANGKAIPSVIPWWLERKGDKFKIIKERANAVRLIYKKAIQGKGGATICKELHDEGIAAPRKSYWNKTYVRDIIRDRRTRGEMQFREVAEDGSYREIGDVVKTYYPEIVSETIWEQANAALDRRKSERGPSSKFVNLFSGLVWNVNDDCQASIYSYQQPRKKNGKVTHKVTIRRLKSIKAAYNVPGADHATVDLDTFEYCVLFCLEGIDPANLLDDDKPDVEEQAVKRAKLHRITKNLDAMRKQIREGEADFAVLQDDVKQMAVEKLALEKELRLLGMRKKQSPNAQISNLLQLAKHHPEKRAELRDAIKSLVEQIFIMPFKTGSHRSDPVVAACQIKFKNGQRFSFVFEKPRGSHRKGNVIPTVRVMTNVKMCNLEETTKKWRESTFIKQWEKEKAISDNVKSS